MTPLIRVVLCSRDLKLRPVLAPALGKEFGVTIEPRRRGVKELVAQQECDVVILDLDPTCCPMEEQIDLYEEIAEFPVAILVMASDDVRSSALELVQRGAFGYMRKPPALRELKVLARRAYENTILKRENRTTRRESPHLKVCGDLVGESVPMQAVYGLIHRIASLDAPVLITGETGTGKELVARAIHSLGRRARRPFVAVPCGAIPENLIEAELFGHEKGAFTSSTGQREGYFEKAGDGTLLLDEIGELSLQTQVKLLRVLQEREFSRLGSSSLIPLRARIVFATHRNLDEMVATGDFRHDLLYRIKVMEIHLPPLHDHPEDIEVLTRHFLRRYSNMYGKSVEAIEPGALTALESYDWPGNVRELENVIQRAIIMAEGSCIRVRDLPQAMQELDDAAEFFDETCAGSFENLVRDYRIRLANEAIQECNGNKTLAAQRLSISRAYLHRLIRVPTPITTARRA